MVKGIVSWEFPKEQSLVEEKPESGTQKYSKCQTPLYEKNKLLLNEYLCILRPTHPTKVRKIPHFFFETFPNFQYIKYNNGPIQGVKLNNVNF